MFFNFIKRKIKKKIDNKRSGVIKGINKNLNFENQLKYYVHSFGKKNPHKKFYVIQRFLGGGMFSNLNYVIRHIKIALQLDCIPIIDMKNFPTKYNEKTKVKNTLNAWEYYFEPINKYKLEDVFKSKFVIVVDGKTRKKSEFDTFKVSEKENYQIFKKYIKIKKEIKNEAEKFLKKNFFNKKVLGVHFRGSDMKTQERHPFPSSLKQITSFIDYEINNNDYNRIFLVTEELDYIEKLKLKYKDMICYNSSYRSNDPDIFKNHKRKNHRYLIGKENIIDMLLLSKTKTIICTNSNMADASSFLTKSKIRLIQINNGYNSNNLFFAQFGWYVKNFLPEFFGGFKLKR
jgi:hypothetical protein